jgi:hypothetical protein
MTFLSRAIISATPPKRFALRSRRVLAAVIFLVHHYGMIVVKGRACTLEHPPSTPTGRTRGLGRRTGQGVLHAAMARGAFWFVARVAASDREMTLRG